MSRSVTTTRLQALLGELAPLYPRDAILTDPLQLDGERRAALFAEFGAWWG